MDVTNEAETKTGGCATFNLLDLLDVLPYYDTVDGINEATLLCSGALLVVRH